MDANDKKYGQVLTPIRIDDSLVSLLLLAQEASGENKSEFVRNAIHERIKKLARKNEKLALALKATVTV